MKKFKCKIHKKYKGKNKPKYQCLECYALYLKINSKPRILPIPTKVMKDKSKYNRKKKHKRGEE